MSHLFGHLSVPDKCLDKEGFVVARTSSDDMLRRFSKTNSDEEEFVEYAVERSTPSTENDSNSDIYDIVDSIVPRYDNPMEPTVTFRVLVLGTLAGVVLGVFNTVFSLRTNTFTVNKYFVLLATYPLGNLMYWTLSTRTYTIPYLKWKFTLNPGPFNFKEQALIFVCAQSGANPPYAIYNIIAQKFMLKQDISLAWCLAFGVLTQLVGYGIAGLCRRFLVRPTGMLWPRQLSSIATLKSLYGFRQSGAHPEDNTDEERKNEAAEQRRKIRFFWLCAAAMCVYQFLPSLVAPLLSAVSMLCYTRPFNQSVRMLASAVSGVGLASLSFDWPIGNKFVPLGPCKTLVPRS